MMPLGSILGQSGVGEVFFNLFKIPFLLLLVVVIIFHLRYRIRLNSISILFLTFGLFSLFNGLLNNDISKAFFTHVYGLILPVLGLSFGSYFYKYAYDQDVRLFHTVFKWSFFLLAGLTFVYFLLYISGVINYFGMATRWPYLAAYALSNNKLMMFIAAILLVIMTGKRSMIIQYIVFIFVYFIQTRRINPFALKKSVKLVFLLFIIGGVFLGLHQGVFHRFDSLLKIDFQDEYSLYIATSGRSAEVFGLLSHLADNTDIWLMGGGFGETFTYMAGLDGEPYAITTHYSHFSPFYFVLVYGAPFTILLYLSIICIMIRSFTKISDVFYMIAVGGFIASFFSSIMLVDLQFWIYFGGVIHASKNKKVLGKFNLVTRKNIIRTKGVCNV